MCTQMDVALLLKRSFSAFDDIMLWRYRPSSFWTHACSQNLRFSAYFGSSYPDSVFHVDPRMAFYRSQIDFALQVKYSTSKI